MNFVFFGEVLVNGENVASVVSRPPLSVLRSRVHRAFCGVALGKEIFQGRIWGAIHVWNLDGFAAKFPQRHLHFGAFGRHAGYGDDARCRGEFDLLHERTKRACCFAGFFGLGDIDFDTG